MIFGFNTDITHDGTVYHVQSEARQGELLLQTQVFVGGRCVGTRAMSYAEASAQPGFADQQMHELLKAQHRSILDAIRENRLETVMVRQGAVQDVSGRGLGLQLLNASRRGDSGFVIRFLVTDEGAPVRGARVSAGLAGTDADNLCEGITEANGAAELTLPVDAGALQEAGVLVHATHNGKSATRKFRLRKG